MYWTNKNKRRATAISCLGAALLLLAVAFQNPKQELNEGWVALNDEVAAALEGWNSDSSKLISSAADLEQGVQGGGVEKGDDGRSDSVDDMVEGDTSIDTMSDSDKLDSIQSAAAQSSYYNGMLDINLASIEELMTLPGIGPSKAQAIADDRELNGRFSTVNDLVRVRGIGEKMLERLKESIVVRP